MSHRSNYELAIPPLPSSQQTLLSPIGDRWRKWRTVNTSRCYQRNFQAQIEIYICFITIYYNYNLISLTLSPCPTQLPLNWFPPDHNHGHGKPGSAAGLPRHYFSRPWQFWRKLPPQSAVSKPAPVDVATSANPVGTVSSEATTIPVILNSCNRFLCLHHRQPAYSALANADEKTDKHHGCKNSRKLSNKPYLSVVIKTNRDQSRRCLR